MHAYKHKNIRNHLHINTYIQCKQNLNICIHTEANSICSSLLRSVFQSQKKQRTLHAGERFLIFGGQDKHTKLQTYSHTQTHIHTAIHTQLHTYVHYTTYIVTYIDTYMHTMQTYIHTLKKYINTYIHTYINMYTMGEDFQYHRRHMNPLFPRDMRSGSSN